MHFWDNYKGILMFLVVFGHFIYTYSNNLADSFARDIYVFIYSFHMPAFIFCSGYFSRSEHARGRESLVKLLLYYIVFNTLMALFARLYMGTKFKFVTPYYSYWYILALILWRIMIGPLSRVKYIVPLSLLISLLMGYVSDFPNAFAVRRTAAFFVFFAAGYLMDREKFEEFLSRRKTAHVAVGMVGTALVAAAAFFAVQRFGITGGMTLMNAYGEKSSILHRLLIFGISFAAIIGMFCAVPNCEIPLLSRIGRNSLLVYLAHRFITIVYYREFFHYRNYTYRYIVYAAITAVITCAVLSGDKLNRLVAKVFDRAALAVCDRKSEAGNRIISAVVVIFCALLCACAAEQIAGFIETLPAR